MVVLHRCCSPAIPSCVAAQALATILVLIGCASDSPPLAHTDHRVIVRYEKSDAGLSIADQSANLYTEFGVVRVQPLYHVFMAVVSLNSSLAAERFVRTLEKDGPATLGVLDTQVTAFDFGAQAGGQRHSAPPAACAANPACRMRGLTVGDCCPVADGTTLSCCASGVQSWITLRSFHSTYIVASRSGTVGQSSNSAEGAVFEVFANGDDSISLRSIFGSFLAADIHGHVNLSTSDNAALRFNLRRGPEGEVSLASQSGLYLCADNRGGVVANRAEALDWEHFVIMDWAGSGQRIGNDPAMSRLWALQDWSGFDIDAPEAWHIWTGEVGRGVTVAIIDTGVDYSHRELHEQMWVNPLEIPGNGVDDDGNGFVDDVHGADFVNEDGDPMDDQMHGTHCAGTIAAVGNNGIGIAGIAWRGVRLMALKFLDASGAGRTSDAIRAIDYAVAQGAKISSNSWGGGGSNSALRTAIEHAEDAGMLFLVASGNEGANNDRHPTFPANYDIDNVLSVASTTRDGKISDFSCYGRSTVHVAAPGTDIYSTVPGNGYTTLSGTSMATPHVAGLAALVWMYRPQLTMHQVRKIIIGSIVPLPSLKNKTVSGGMINAKNALESAWAFEPPQPPIHAPRGIAFRDTDPRIGVFGGVVTITAALDESDVEYYRVYIVSAAGFQLAALGDRIPATGDKLLTVQVNESFMPPLFARGLVAVSGRSSGEMPAVVNGSAPFVVLQDFGLPEYPAQWATFGGDVDLRLGAVRGTLKVGRARDEVSVQKYNIYWHSYNGTTGSFLGSFHAVGYQEPVCTGDACGSLKVQSLGPGISHYEKSEYSDLERTRISLSGPGTVLVTTFVTEHYYDSLTIGDVRLSGNLTSSLPVSIELPAGPLTIRWISDESISGGGWSFELHQAGAVASFDLNVSEAEGPGVDVLPAYDSHELPESAVFAKIIDFTSAMGVSPAFAPQALRFYNGTFGNGSLQGIVEVVPAVDASFGNIGYYLVCVADSQGSCLEARWTATPDDLDASAPVFLQLAPTVLSDEAAMLVACAGNSKGLSSAFVSVPLAELVPRRLSEGEVVGDAEAARTSPADAGIARQQVWITKVGVRSLVGFEDDQDHAAAPMPSHRGSGYVGRLLWAADREASLVANVSHHPCVRTAVSFSGLTPAIAVLPSVHVALARAVATQMPSVASGSVVRVVRVFDRVTTGAELAEGGALESFRFELEVQVPDHTSQIIVDIVESYMILLSASSATVALESFHAALLHEMEEAVREPSVRLSEVRFAAPQQLNPKMLAAFTEASKEDTSGDRRLRGNVL